MLISEGMAVAKVEVANKTDISIKEFDATLLCTLHHSEALHDRSML